MFPILNPEKKMSSIGKTSTCTTIRSGKKIPQTFFLHRQTNQCTNRLTEVTHRTSIYFQPRSPLKKNNYHLKYIPAFLLIVYPFPSSVSSVATVTKLILHPRGAIPHLSASGKGRREEGNQSVYV